MSVLRSSVERQGEQHDLVICYLLPLAAVAGEAEDEGEAEQQERQAEDVVRVFVGVHCFASFKITSSAPAGRPHSSA